MALRLLAMTLSPEKKNKTPLCARWGRGQLGQNGIIDEEDVEGDIDEEDVEGDDVEETEADDSDSDEDEQSDGDEDWTVVDMEQN